MSAQKRLSQLSLAGISLLVVALPCFAQNDPADKTSAASETDASAIVAVNRESVTRESRVEAKSVAAADTKTKAPKFSATTFLKAAGEAPVSTTSISFQPVADRFERKESGRVNGVTFVASRGQKLPE